MDFGVEEKLWRRGGVLIGVDEAGRGPLAGPVVAAAVALLPNSVIPAKACLRAPHRQAGIQDSLDSTGFPIRPALDYNRGPGMTRKERKTHFIIQSDLLKLGINDSKKLTPKKRDEIFEKLTNHPSVLWAVGSVDEKAIDKINILQASLLAMRHAVEAIFKIYCNRVAIDGEDRLLSVVLVDGREVVPDLNVNQKAVIGGDSKIFSIAAASIIAKVTRDRLMSGYAKKYPQYQFEKHKGYGTKLHYEMIRAHGLSPIHRKSFKILE